MITLDKFKLSDYEELVDMYYEFNKDVYQNRKIGDKYFFYKAVMKWINQDADIVLSRDGDIVTGFSMCYKDMFGGLTETIYQCDLCYVKPAYRKSRSAYMLYNNAYEYAKELGLKICASGRVENGVDKMMMKHFGLEKTFTTLEGE